MTTRTPLQPEPSDTARRAPQVQPEQAEAASGPPLQEGLSQSTQRSPAATSQQHILRLQRTLGNQHTSRVLNGANAALSLLQRLGQSLAKPAAEAPAHGEDPGRQRQYSVEQYIEMWEAEQGRKLTEDEKKTVARGCIGITALNLTGGGNPPLDEAYDTFEAAKAAMDKKNADIDRFNSWVQYIPFFGEALKKKNRAVLFAKMFWSNQDADPEKRKKADPTAFKADKHGRVDMSDYKYLRRPGFINFDYAFWDEASQSFWHANHSQPGMKVYQSTRERFEEGYADFDRTIYCVAIAENYDPGKAAVSH